MPDPAPWVPIGATVVPNGQVGRERTGQAPVSGRCTALASADDDPFGRIWAGTAGGGVWRTDDGGRTWKPLCDRMPSLAIGALAVDPIDRDRVYAGTGEANEGGMVFHGVGLYRSDDGGDTWTVVPAAGNPFVQQRFAGLAVDPLATDTIYAAVTGSAGGVYRSDDRGDTWTLLRAGRAVDLVLVPHASDRTQHRLYAAFSGEGVFRLNLTPPNTGGPLGAGSAPSAVGGGLPQPTAAAALARIALAGARSAPQTLYAAFATPSDTLQGLYRTDDGGSTWNQLPVPTGVAQTNYNLVLAVHPTNPDVVYFGEVKLWRSANGGQAWDSVVEPTDESPGLHADQHAILTHRSRPDNLLAGNDGGVFLSTDRGTTWKHRNRGLQTMQYYALAHHPTWPSLGLAGAQDNGTQRYEGSPAWRLVAYGDGFFCGIDPADGRYWYSSYVFKQTEPGPPPVTTVTAVSRSDEGGRADTFQYKVSGINQADSGRFFVPFVLDPTNPSVLYLGTTRLYRSDNRGDTWTVDPSFAPTGQDILSIAVAPSQPTRLYLGTDGRTVHRVDRTTPPAVVSFTLAAGPVTSIAVDPHDADHAFAAAGSPHLAWWPAPAFPQRIFETTDGGASWAPVAGGLPAAGNPMGGVQVDQTRNPVNALVIDPDHPDRLYAGCNVGLFRSDDNGNTWRWWNEGLPNCAVNDLDVVSSPRLLRATTTGRGVWERPLDDPPAAPPRVEIYLRDSIADVGRAPSQDLPDPTRPGQTIRWNQSGSIKVDTPGYFVGDFQTPVSTVDFTPGGEPDYIAFAEMADRSPRGGTESRVLLEVLNRGPDVATTVKARVYWASTPGDAFPDLQSGFWGPFPDADPPDGGPWRPIGPARTVARLLPADPAVVRWQWTPPADVGKVNLLAAVTCAEDPLFEVERDVATVVRNNPHVVVKQLDTTIPSAAIVVLVLAGIGIATIATIGIIDAVND